MFPEATRKSTCESSSSIFPDGEEHFYITLMSSYVFMGSQKKIIMSPFLGVLFTDKWYEWLQKNSWMPMNCSSQADEALMPKDPLPSGPQAWTRISPQPWISKVFLAGEKGVQQEKWWFTARKELISAGEAGWEQLITVDNYIVQL